MTKKLLFASMLVAAATQLSAAPQVPQYSLMSMPVSNGYFHGGMVFVDLNNDGFMDMIVKGRDLNNGWSTDIKAIYNLNGEWDSEASLPNDGCSWERTIATIDYDNDGWVDYLLLSSWGNELYRNNGDGSFSKVDNFTLPSNISIDGGNGNDERWYTGLSAVADFDHDGWQDIIVIDGDGNPALYVNNQGDGSFTLKEDAGLFAQRGGTIYVGDYNRDGSPDLLVSGWNDEVGSHCVRINKNNGDGTFTTVNPGDGVLGTEMGQVMFVDVDGDGWLDIFVTGQCASDGWNKEALIYRNNGNDTFSKVETSLTGACKSGCEWVDVNGDGLIDIIYAGETDNESRTVVVINEGSLTFTAHEDLLGRARGGAVVAAFDSNNNGFANVSVMGYNDDGAPHFGIWNGLCNNRYANVAPDAPANLTAVAGDGKVTLKWDAASDSKTPADALRYNVYVKLNDGKLITLVPADPETGKLRQGDVNAAINACQYQLGVNASQIAEWGVQAIDGGKAASAFAKATVDGISQASGNTGLRVYTQGNRILTSMPASVSVTDMAGRSHTGTQFAAGIYVVKATAADGNTVVSKVIIK